MQIYSDKIFKNPQKIISAFDSESFIFAFQEIEKLKNLISSNIVSPNFNFNISKKLNSIKK